MSPHTRALTATDVALLRTACWLNFNWTGPARIDFRELDHTPQLRKYFEFQPERGDFGLVAEREGLPLGVVWLLFLEPPQPGYGFVAADIPELSICVWPGYRGQGLGHRLLHTALGEAKRRQIPGVSLSVETDNPSRRLYLDCGFRDVQEAAPGTMLARL